jgi:SAM-dependent methyltransferase
VPLFGDRKQFGLTVQPDDPCWQEWQKTYLNFYYSNQKRSVGKVINNAGYRIMSKVDINGKKVLEIGPGDINHIDDWKGTPLLYVIADIRQEMLDISSMKLGAKGISYDAKLLDKNSSKLPFGEEEFDIVVSFYSFEHLYPFPAYLDEILRVLKHRGKLVGAIPCEGGLLWGIGRFMISRRWLKKHTSINPDKIICWEHPNFADMILNILDLKMHKQYLGFWPFMISSIDINLIVKFIYEKP